MRTLSDYAHDSKLDMSLHSKHELRIHSKNAPETNIRGIFVEYAC